MDQTQKLDVDMFSTYVSKIKQKTNVNVQELANEQKGNMKKNTSIKTIKTKPRRSCKPYFKILLRIGVLVAVSAMGYWTYDVSKTMMRTFWERPDSFTVDTLK